MRRPVALLVALGIGISIVATSQVIATMAGRPIPADQWEDELPILITQVIIVASPFLFMTLAGIRARRPWVVGLVLTIALWGYYLLDALVLAERGRGVNIGLAFLMLASPVIISIICGILGLTGRRPVSSKRAD